MRGAIPGFVVVVASLVARALPAQDSITVIADTGYDIHRTWYPILGHNWRDLWAAPIRVPVLDVGRFAGGLVPFRTGGNQTETLWFHDGDGRTWIFRSVAKQPSAGVIGDLRHGMAGMLINDESSAYHPAAALVVAPLEERAGVRDDPPQLVVLPDDPRLDSFRVAFAGKLGEIEVRPDESADAPSPFGAAAIKSTETMFKDLDESLAYRIDARAWLAARLVDALVGDTDRGCDQWRWAEYDDGPFRDFRPIARDRDHAFADRNGLVGTMLRAVFSKESSYGPGMPSLGSVTYMTHEFDRNVLVALDWAAWDSVVTAIRTAWTDAAIDSAVQRLPPPYLAASGAAIAAGLRGRRDHLGEFAREYYRMVNERADLFGSKGSDRADIERLADGSVVVRLEAESAKPGGERPVALERRFDPRETKEIRIHLEGGADTAVVRGDAAGTGIVVRIVGGKGDDVLADSSGAHQDAAVFYDAQGRNQFIRGPGTRVHRAAYDARTPSEQAAPDSDARHPQEEPRGDFGDMMADECQVRNDAAPSPFQRDWGARTAVMPLLDFHAEYGLTLGAAVVHTTYAFRHQPWQRQLTIAAAGTPFGGGAAAASVTLDLRPENSGFAVAPRVAAGQLQTERFYGYGNATPAIDDSMAWIPRDEFVLTVPVRWYATPRVWIGAGPVLAYRTLHPATGSPGAALPGKDAGGSAGVRGELGIDERDAIALPRNGFVVTGAATWYPSVWDIGDYGRADWQAAAYVSPGSPTIALRAGGARLFGDRFPVYDAALIGGLATVRGVSWDRYAGDAELHGAAELRIPLGSITLLDRGVLGLMLFEDAGRVWYRGASQGGWHNGTGIGLSFTTLGAAVTASYAYGDFSHAYFTLGFPF